MFHQELNKLKAARPESNKRPLDDDTPSLQRHEKRKAYVVRFSNTITVLVGDERTPYMLHKDKICAQSNFFKAACSQAYEPWAAVDVDDSIVRLPEESPEHFETYRDWVYKSQIHISNAISVNEEIGLMRLYLLGIVLDDYKFRNAVMERLIGTLNLIDAFPTSKEIGEVYAKTSAGSPLRRFLVIFAMPLHDPNAPGALEIMAEWPKVFITEMAQELLLDRLSNGPADGSVMGSLQAALRDSIRPEVEPEVDTVEFGREKRVD
jgi:hypothetical protein